jgi:hypothetical protein
MYSEMITKDFKTKSENEFEKQILESLRIADLFRPDIVNNLYSLQNSFNNNNNNNNNYNSIFNNLNKNALESLRIYSKNFPFQGNSFTNFENYPNFDMNKNNLQQTFRTNASEVSSISYPSENTNIQAKKNKIKIFSSSVSKPENSDKQLLNKKTSRCFVKNGKVVFVQPKKELSQKEVLNDINLINNNSNNNNNNKQNNNVNILIFFI